MDAMGGSNAPNYGRAISLPLFLLSVSFWPYCPLARAVFHPLVALPHTQALAHTHTHTNTILAASHEGPRTKDDGVARRLLRRLQRHPRKIQQQVDEDVAVAVDVAVEVEKTRKNVT